MKKVAIIFGVIIGILLVAALAIPTIFKDDILALVDKQLNSQLNAKTSFNKDEFSLSEQKAPAPSTDLC